MFDPSLPANNSPNSSAQMRGQLTSLKALIDAIQSVIAAVIDSVTTVNPGDPAAVTVAIINNELHFSFAIPKGNEGIQGIPGNDGGIGPQGPPFAQCIVDAVNTLAPGSNATVTVSFDGTIVHLTFGIPSGLQGIPGADGAPGEVTNAQMTTAITNAISGTSNNTNAVATLGLTVSDPPTQGEVQSIANKLDEMILAARR